VTCLEVRDRLAEFALGVLPRADAADVERHLEWCTGCRREAGDLQSGLALVAESLPPEEPPASLETRVVNRVVTTSRPSSRGRRGRARRSVLALAAALMAALIVAVGAVGWAVAERGRIQSFEETAAQQAALM
jgi:anti-sigma-K factor RskA